MWNRLSQLGITDVLELQSAKRIVLINRLTMVLCATVLPYSFVFLFMSLYVQAATLMLAFGLFVMMLLLNKSGQYLAARLLIMPVVNAVILYFSLNLGKEAGASFVYFFTAIFPWLIFDAKEKGLALGASLLSIALFFFISLTPYSPSIQLGNAFTTFLNISAGVTTFAMLIITVALFYNESTRTEQSLSETNTSLEDTRRKLQTTLAENTAVMGFAQVMYSNSGSLDELCKAGMHKLKDIMQYTYGAIVLYDKESDMLHVQEEVGFDAATRRQTSFRNGESLTGSAFQQQKTIRIHDAPENYWQATSGLGRAMPAEMILIPMTFKTACGVLELAFIRQPDDAEMAILQRISVAFAANILALESRDENAKLVSILQQQKDEIAHNYAGVEEMHEKANIRMKEQYEAQQILIRQIIEKGKQKEQELTARISELEQKTQTP